MIVRIPRATGVVVWVLLRASRRLWVGWALLKPPLRNVPAQNESPRSMSSVSFLGKYDWPATLRVDISVSE